ncbi:MAG: hypothetical protein ACOVNQ_19735, partial [Pirellula sp.]
MSARNFPPIETVLGLIDDQKKLPVKGSLGDAWYEENAGRLWVWDGELLEWRELNLWRSSGFASSVAKLLGVSEASFAKGATGAIGERGLTGPAGPQGLQGLPGKDG